MPKGIVFSFLSFEGFPLHAWGYFAFFALHPFGVSTLLVLLLSRVTCCSTAYAPITHDRGGGRGGREGKKEGQEREGGQHFPMHHLQ